MTNTLEPTDDRHRRTDDRHDRTNDLHVGNEVDDPYSRTPGPATGGPNRHSALTVERPELVEPRSIRWTTSPFDLHGIGLMVATYVVMTTIMLAVGTALVEWWDATSLGEADADVNRWLEDHRTGWLTTLSEHMSALSDTHHKIIYGVVCLPLMLWLFRRWHEWTLIFIGLYLELAIFITTQAVVGRDRPPVELLEESFTSSFPSGHIAAATTFFLGLGVVILMRTCRRGPRTVAWGLMIGGPLAVAWGRIYMGMHYVTDALAGVTIGIVVVVVMYRVVMRTLPPDESPARHDALVAAAHESAAKEAS